MLGHSHELPPPRPPATLRGPIQRLPAWIKFFAAVALVLSASLCPPTHAIWLLVPTAAVLLIALLSRISPRVLIRRILLLEPFVLGVALLAFFSPGTTEQRWMFFGFLVARCTLALATMVLFAATTPFAEMLRLFRTLRVPMLLVTTLALMHRYLFVLSDEASRMRRARRSRTFSRRRRLEWRNLSTVIGTLFLRAYERADRIYDAMCARGWSASDSQR